MGVSEANLYRHFKNKKTNPRPWCRKYWRGSHAKPQKYQKYEKDRSCEAVQKDLQAPSRIYWSKRGNPASYLKCQFSMSYPRWDIFPHTGTSADMIRRHWKRWNRIGSRPFPCPLKRSRWHRRRRGKSLGSRRACPWCWPHRDRRGWSWQIPVFLCTARNKLFD